MKLLYSENAISITACIIWNDRYLFVSNRRANLVVSKEVENVRLDFTTEHLIIYILKDRSLDSCVGLRLFMLGFDNLAIIGVTIKV